jgi:ribonuclease P protein component
MATLTSRLSGRRAPILLRADAPLRQNNEEVSSIAAPDHRLRKHADYQRVYREARKQFSASMSYFYALRAEDSLVPAGPRVGLTAGKILGKAVERNRIKRRMREIVRRRIGLVRANVDIVLHPRRTVLTIEFTKLESEVARIFTNIQSLIDKGGKPARQIAAKQVES